jgi:hypothetical protein
MKRVGLLLLALMLIVAACGDDGGTDVDALKGEIVDALVADSSPGNPFGTQEAATCVADSVVDGIGADRVQELVDAADDFVALDEFGANMTDAERQTFASSTLGCADLEAFAAANFAAQGLPDEVASCAAEAMFSDEALVEGLFEQAIIAELAGEAFDPTGDPELFGALMEALNPCLGG